MLHAGQCFQSGKTKQTTVEFKLTPRPSAHRSVSTAAQNVEICSVASIKHTQRVNVSFLRVTKIMGHGSSSSFFVSLFFSLFDLK